MVAKQAVLQYLPVHVQPAAALPRAQVCSATLTVSMRMRILLLAVKLVVPVFHKALAHHAQTAVHVRQ